MRSPLRLRLWFAVGTALLHSLSVVAFPTNDIVHRQYDAGEIVVNESLHDVQFHTFLSRPDIDAPRWDIKVHDRHRLDDGYWFISAYGQVEQLDNEDKYVGPYIYDGAGELVWSGAHIVNNFGAFDFKVSRAWGQDLLTMIYPTALSVWMLDEQYELFKTLEAGRDDDPLLPGKHSVNIHDFQVIGDEFIVLNRKMDWVSQSEMKALGYRGDCEIDMNGFQRADLDTGAVSWEWSPRDYIPFSESRVTPTNKKCKTDGWDYAHLNSVDPLPDGDYLLSARHVNAIFKISGVDGHIIWQLNGEKSDFEWTDNGHFMGQHDARLISQNDTHMIISMMDNAIGPWRPKTNNPCSRGLVLALNLKSSPMAVSEVVHYDHPKGTYATGRGNMQKLPNGNAFVGFSDSAFHAEFSADGELLMEAFLPCGVKTYRAYKFPWVGRPNTPPDVFSAATNIGNPSVATSVYVSWNGATEVDSWALYMANKNGETSEAISYAKKTGFETRLDYSGYARFVVVEALDRDGNVLGASEIIKTVESDVYKGVELPPTHEGIDSSNKSPQDDVDSNADGDAESSHSPINLGKATEVAANDSAHGAGSDAHHKTVSMEFMWILCFAILVVSVAVACFLVFRRSGDGRWLPWKEKIQLYKALDQQEHYVDEEGDGQDDEQDDDQGGKEDKERQ